ncbi:MAG TPA: hypothetical protein VFQ54_11910, partial [Thermomicrobiales bacterium]|nr:hypothetical protein [Thermomicrobiales bacterium]
MNAFYPKPTRPWSIRLRRGPHIDARRRPRQRHVREGNDRNEKRVTRYRRQGLPNEPRHQVEADRHRKSLPISIICPVLMILRDGDYSIPGDERTGNLTRFSGGNRLCRYHGAAAIERYASPNTHGNGREPWFPPVSDPLYCYGAGVDVAVGSGVSSRFEAINELGEITKN